MTIRRLRRSVLPIAIAAALVTSVTGANAVSRSPNGVIAFSGEWAEDRFDQVFSVDVVTGNERSLTPVESLAGSLAAVSPDGATILFQRQSIWRMDADGGNKRELAPGSEPAWSRDGKRIAYVDAAGYITTMDVEGGDRRRLVRGTLPVWSPDGRWIAYVERGSPVRVMVVGADGTGPRSLYSTTDVFLSVLWSPDETAVVVAADDLIVLLPVAGGAERVLVRDIAGVTGLKWSPNGSRLAFARSGRLWTVSASGAGMVALTDPRLPGTGSEVGWFDSSPQWSPDGRSIAFIRMLTSPRVFVRQEIWTVPAGGGDARQVTKPTDDRTFRTKLAWSGDGRSLVYSRALLFDRRGVLSVRPDGTQLSRLLLGARAPAFSPDGRLIAFVVNANPTVPVRGELFVMRSDGSNVTQLTRSDGQEGFPSWSPDGSRIVFTRGVPDSQRSAVYTIRVDGTGLRRLRAATAQYTEPAWSPDGRSILVGRDGDLINLNPDGSNPRRIPGVGRRGQFVSSPAWSPNGERISFIRRCFTGCTPADAGLWTVGRQGERPHKLAADAHHAAWAPDGSRLVVIKATDRTIHILSPAGRSLRKLGFNAVSVSWQPICARSGSPRADRLVGAARGELICGLGGADRITGGRGRDRLLGGDGNDTIDARDGAFDVVGCGPGTDTAHVDPLDYVGVDCERVSRR